MANLVVLQLESAPPSLKGRLSRLMLEVHPGLYVWKLSVRKTRQIWEEIQQIDCSAICVFAARNESGFVIAIHGNPRREVVDNFGVPLIRY